MDKLVLRSLFACAMTAGIMGAAQAQVCDPKDPKCPPAPPPPPPAGAPCSPGYWKNHTELWFFNGSPYCSNAGQPTCEQLMMALTCKGSNVSCGRSAAAAYLNNLTGCTESD